MKKKNTKKSFGTFAKRNTHKRKSRERAKRELLRIQSESALSQRRYNAHEEITAEGVFSASKSGFGFVSVDGEDRDIFIPESKTLGALDDDRVEIVYHKFFTSGGEEKTEGRVKKITHFGRKTVIGTVMRATLGKRRGNGVLILIPDDPKLTIQPIITTSIGVKPGDKIKAKLLRKGSFPECEPLINFGESLSKEANYEAILDECGIIGEFTKEEEAEARFFASMPISYEGRENFTSETIFTIDGAGAKDLDDAISIRKLPKGAWRLGVHIADVSHYVKERTHLDRAAMARGTSVYFTDKVVPMLPTALSNGACSLNPGEEKYALSAIMKISPNGEILETRITPSVIKSRVRGVYSEVNEVFFGTASAEILKKYSSVIPALTKMHELYLVLKKRSESRGALELDSPEAEIILDEAGKPIGLVKRERADAEKLIEQFMLAANEGVATLLSDKKIPCVYRIHEAPPEEKLSDFLTYMHNLGFDTAKISHERCSPSDFSALLFEAKKRELSLPVSYTMLRSMSKAKYSETNQAHFGLGIQKYCHFTSPIRRLSDLATHRIIHKVLLEDKRPELYSGYAKRAAAAATEAELRAQNAERRIENLYKVIYMSDKVGEVFDAIISSVTAFGLFCMPENTCEGLIPISEIGDYFIFDEKTLTLRSANTRYTLGDKIKVRLEEADMIKGKLRYSIAEN